MVDLSKFKKVGATKTHTIMESPEGHTIHLAHSALDEGSRKALKSLPVQKLSDGGDVENQPTPITGSPIRNYADGGSVLGDIGQWVGSHVIEPGVNAVANMFPGDPSQPQMPDATPAPANEGGAQTMPQNYQLPQQSQSPMAGMADPYGTQATLDAYTGGLKNAKAGLFQAAAAEGKQGQMEAQAEQNTTDQLQQLQAHHQDEYNKLNQERMGFVNDINSGHIDPLHFWHEKSIPGKVSTAIGIILGGLGNSDAPLKFLNSNIDRDIEAQKLDLGRKQSLLEANLHQFGNLKDATDMTRVMKMDMLSAQLKKAAGTTADQAAKGRALQAAGKLDMESANQIGQLTMRRTIMQAMNKGQVDPSMAIRALVPEKEQEQASKTLGTIQQIESFRKDLHTANDQLNNMTGRGAFSPNQRASIVNLLAGKLSHVTAGRYNGDEAKKQVESLLVGKSDFAPSTRELKDNNVDELMDTLRAEHEPQLRRFGIEVPKAPRSAKRNTNVPSNYR